MSAFASMMIAASAAIIFTLGIIHLVYTYRGPKLLPRDPDLQARMSEVSPVISRETTTLYVLALVANRA